MNTSEDANRSGLQHFAFGWLDCSMFILTIAISAVIGIYFGFCGKNEDTPIEYLHGGKKLSTIPIALSLTAGFVSGIIQIGYPTEMYVYGTLLWLSCVSAIIGGIITNYFFLPVLYDLQRNSIYEYLELRFNRSVRIMASTVNAISLILFIPLLSYVAALVFNTVSGIHMYYIIIAISTICIAYTTLGGIKGVVWSDFLQYIIMLVSSIAIIVVGVIKVGGMDTVWERSERGGRIQFFEMSLSPFTRMSFWSVIIGDTIHWIGVAALRQESMQRFIALPSYSKARWSLILYIIGTVITISLSCYTGLLIFATYEDCDPIKSKAISIPDQLLPYYLLNVAGKTTGIPGLFVAGLFSGALSSMSSCLNATGATIFEDFVRPCLKRRITDKCANNFMKSLVFIVGVISVIFALFINRLGTVVQVTLSLSGATIGAITGLFTFGMFYPRGNSKGALAGSVCSLLVMGWIVLGNQAANANGSIKNPVLPTSVQGCTLNISSANGSQTDIEDEKVFVLYRISIMYYNLMGIVIVVIVGIIVSLFTEPPEEEKNHPSLFTPLVRKYVLARNKRANVNRQVALKLLNKNSS